MSGARNGDADRWTCRRIHSSSCRPANDLTVSQTQARQLLNNFSRCDNFSVKVVVGSLHLELYKIFHIFFEKIFELALF